jgi:hypothetical protein
VGRGCRLVSGDPEFHENAAFAVGDGVAGNLARFTVENDARVTDLRFDNG